VPIERMSRQRPDAGSLIEARARCPRSTPRCLSISTRSGATSHSA
jgi:hypothetical protein